MAGPPDTVPNPPKITLVSDLFMATHMTLVRNAPDDPISAPTTVSSGWSRINPSAHSALNVMIVMKYEDRTVRELCITRSPQLPRLFSPHMKMNVVENLMTKENTR